MLRYSEATHTWGTRHSGSTRAAVPPVKDQQSGWNRWRQHTAMIPLPGGSSPFLFLQVSADTTHTYTPADFLPQPTNPPARRPMPRPAITVCRPQRRRRQASTHCQACQALTHRWAGKPELPKSPPGCAGHSSARVCSIDPASSLPVPPCPPSAFLFASSRLRVK